MGTNTQGEVITSNEMQQEKKQEGKKNGRKQNEITQGGKKKRKKQNEITQGGKKKGKKQNEITQGGKKNGKKQNEITQGGKKTGKKVPKQCNTNNNRSKKQWYQLRKKKATEKQSRPQDSAPPFGQTQQTRDQQTQTHETRDQQTQAQETRDQQTQTQQMQRKQKRKQLKNEELPSNRSANMPSEQEFCLRWNEHKSTLITIFESLLESDILVDCTLAAEGQCLKAHKVVLSACSPYFQFLLTQHTDKHPIIILKDVKFEELRAMIDYMYRGEVNIPEAQLGPLLKAAESLQIRGLGGTSIRDKHGKVDKPSMPNVSSQEKHTLSPQREVRSDSPAKGISASTGKVLRTDVRKGSLSPVPRKRTCSNHILKVENESQSKTVVEQPRLVSPVADVVATSLSSTTNQNTSTMSVSSWGDLDRGRPPSLHMSSGEKEVSLVGVPSFGRPLEEPGGSSGWVCELGLRSSSTAAEELGAAGGLPQAREQESEVLLVPKTEYVEIDDDSLTNVMLDEVQDMDACSAPGPSHGDGAPGSSGFVPWLQNIEGITHPIANQEPSGSYQPSQALMSARKGNTCCSVAGCRKSYGNTQKTIKFYRFPARQHDQPLRKLWIDSINRAVGFKKPWQPNKYSRVCSKHFVGNRKSFDPASPSYIPTIFPPK